MKKILFAAVLLIVCSTMGPLYAQINLPEYKTVPEPEYFLDLDKESYRPGEKAVASVTIIFPEGFHQNHDEKNFKLQGGKTGNFIYGSTLYPVGKKDKEGLAGYHGQARLRLEFLVPESLAAGFHSGSLTLFYQLCDEEGLCYFPESRLLDFTLQIAGSPVGGSPADSQTVSDRGSKALWLFLLMALAGGFLLNFMPCVLPLLSVKAMNLVSQSNEKKEVLVKHALLYSLGILASFWVFSLIIILLQQSGHLLGWGFHFQSPLFLAILISIIYLFALSLFEVFLLAAPPSGMNKADQFSRKKGYAGSFLTGIFAVFVATPCTAPFLGSAMGFAFVQSPAIIVAMMTFTGLGLSLPFLLLGFYPGFFKIFPKAGAWMDRFRQAMAFALLATVVYLCHTLIKQIGEDFGSVLWFLLILSLAAWIWGWSGRKSRRKIWRRVFILLPLGAVILSGLYLLDFSESSPPFMEGKQGEWELWEEFAPGDIPSITDKEALFLAFSAEWCTSCKINEKTVLNTKEALDLFSEKGIRRMKADLSLSNPVAMEWIYRYGRAGVPLYLLFIPGKEAIILPEILTLQILKDAFQGIPEKSN